MRPRSGAFSTGEPIVTHNSSATRLCHACLPCSFEGGITTAAPPIIAIQVGIGQTRKQFHQIRVGLARWLTRSHRPSTTACNVANMEYRACTGGTAPSTHTPSLPDVAVAVGTTRSQDKHTTHETASSHTFITQRTFPNPNLAERVLDRKETTAAISAAAAVHGIKGAASQC